MCRKIALQQFVHTKIWGISTKTATLIKTLHHIGNITLNHIDVVDLDFVDLVNVVVWRKDVVHVVALVVEGHSNHELDRLVYNNLVRPLHLGNADTKQDPLYKVVVLHAVVANPLQ